PMTAPSRHGIWYCTRRFPLRLGHEAEENQMAHQTSRHYEVLSPKQRADLAEFGYLKLPGAIPRAVTEIMCDRMWDALAVAGIERHDPTTWPRPRPERHGVDHLAQRRPLEHLKKARQGGAFAGYASPISAVVDDLLGRGAWRPPARWGIPMVTFPSPHSSWTVPATGWHLDGSPRTGPAERLVRTFALLADHDPGS